MVRRFENFLRLAVILFLPLKAQWTELGSPGDNAFYALCNEGDTIYAATQFDLLRSTNNGETWQLKDAGLPSQLPAVSLTATNGIVFAGSDNSGVYRSTDHGNAWSAANTGLPALARNVRVVYGHAGRVYLGVAGSGSTGFYYSTDNGDSWNPFVNGPDTTVTGFVGSGDTLVAGTISGKVFVSTNLGQTWRDTVVSPFAPSIRGIAMMKSFLFVTTEGHGIFRSLDAGLTWSNADSGFTDDPAWVRPIAIIDSTLFTGIDYSGNGGVWRSTNRGDLWENVSGMRMTVTTAPPTGTVNVYYKQYAMLVHGSRLFAGTFGYGLLTSDDLGTTWHHVNTPFRQYVLSELAVFGDTVLAGTSAIEGAYVSTNLGKQWEQYRANLGVSVMSFTKFGSNIYAGGVNGNIGYGVFKSSDGGLSWTQMSTGLPVSISNMIIQDNGILYAATDGGLYKSTNGGAQWNATSWTMNAAGVFAHGDTVIVSRLSPQRTYRSTNGGTTWDSLGGGLPLNFAARSFAVIGNRLFMCGTGSTLTLFVSTNSGVDWTNITGSTQAVQVLAAGDTLWVNGITPLYSTNFGQSWTPMSTTGVPGGSFSKIAVGGGWLFGSVGGPGQHGLYRRTLPVTVDVHGQETAVVTSYTIEQNYPNPFNPTTTISYALPQDGMTTLKIYDALGREVKTLVNEFKTTGRYTATFDASTLSSGVYMYKLVSDKYSTVKKMLLVK